MSSNIPKPSSIPLMPNIEDGLYVGFDKHQDEETVMIVMRRDNGKDIIINGLIGKEAEEVYKKLIGWDKI